MGELGGFGFKTWGLVEIYFQKGIISF